ncbi:MAG: tetratricopeptide repeat protein [Deltaproteobacteria bacterium]
MGRKQLTILLVASMFAGALPLAVGAQNGGGDSGGQCIQPVARQTVEACPSGAPPPDRRSGAASPASHLTTRAREEAQPAKQQQTAPGVELSAAERRGRAAAGQQRALDLLRREIETTERIVGRLRAGDVRGADYLLRLAETYFELQTYWNTRARALDEQIFQAQEARNAEQVRELQRQQQESEQQLTGARENAIRTYARLVQDYPSYGRMDEVLFSLAFGLEEMRQFERARQVYMRLIKGHPDSRFVPYAWLSFAEYYFSDGDMNAARQFYSKVLEYPQEQNPVYGFALYKQAWVLYNLEDFRGALNQFVQVLEFTQAHPDARDALNRARLPRRVSVLRYARVGRPNQALQFFQRYATSQDQAFEMLESLAELYFDTGQWPETIQIYHTLMAERTSSDRLCYWQSRVTNAVVSSRPKAEQVTEIQRLVDMEGAFRTGGSHPQQAITECRQVTAQVLFETAVAWHREAIGSSEQPGTNDRRTMQQATELYELAIRQFPDMEELEFPDISRDDWPTVYRVSYFYAELLWRMEDWNRCGPAFDHVVELNPQGEYTSDAAYAAVLCYNNLYQQQYAATERERRPAEGQAPQGRRGRRRQAEQEPEQTEAQRLAVREFTGTEQGMLNAFQRFVCFVSQSEELPQVKYRRARSFYESNRFEEAAVIFRDIAFNHPQHELAEFAANLYLDSLNAISRREGRVSCVTEIKNNIEPMFALYCNSQEQLDAHADLCGVLQQLRCDVLRQEAEIHTRNREFREAAAVYVDIYRRFRECGRLDEVLYNAAINYESARLLGRAIRVRQVLIERFPESELAKRALYLVGANYHALAIYSQAANFYEQFARRFPGEDGANCTDAERTAGTCAIAHVALENAVFFRLGLGEEETAIQDAQLYERSYRRTRARETSQVVFSLGSIYERQGNWNRVFDHYRTFLRNYGRTALPHEVIRANVQMGRAQWQLEHRDQAEPHFRAATQAYERGAVDAINRAEGSDEDRALWLARAREATSEALFYLAEYRFAEFRAVRFPQYRGPTTLVAVNRWSQTELFPWLQRKFEALRTAEGSYNLIEPLQIPQWQIAAAARVGEMYRTIIDDVRSAPVPDEIARDPELEGIYLDALENVLNGSNPGPDGRWETEDDVRCSEGAGSASCQGAPIPRALGAFEYCLTLATRVRWFNEWSAQCEQELNQLDRARFPLAAELRGTASFVQDQIAEPGPVELSTDNEAEGDSTESSVPEAGQT